MTEAVASTILIIAIVLGIVWLERAGDPAVILIDAAAPKVEAPMLFTPCPIAPRNFRAPVERKAWWPQTSDRVSSIAARFANVGPETLMALCAKPSTAAVLAKDIRSMAASLLRQDETKGLRGLMRKVFGR